jgi:hypothetical protein
MASTGSTERVEAFLEADKEIPGQHYVCLSFVTPSKFLPDKRDFFFAEFLKDYEIQYRIKATEEFMMGQVAKVQDALSPVVDQLENLVLKGSDASVADISGALTKVKAVRTALTLDTSAALEAHVKANLADFRESKLREAYDTFMMKNKKKLEDKFFEENRFQTTMHGLKVRGVFDTHAEAAHRAKTLQKIDPIHNIYVATVGQWLPWDPEPHEGIDAEYADEQLNTLMKKYKENESKREEFFAEQKAGRIMGAKIKETESSTTPHGMFGGDDLAIARKRAAAAPSAAPANTISHSE